MFVKPKLHVLHCKPQNFRLRRCGVRIETLYSMKRDYETAQLNESISLHRGSAALPTVQVITIESTFNTGIKRRSAGRRGRRLGVAGADTARRGGSRAGVHAAPIEVDRSQFISDKMETIFIPWGGVNVNFLTIHS